MDIFGFVFTLGVFAYLALSLFWGVTAAVVANWSGQNRWLGLLFGALFHVIGVVIVLIIGSVKKSSGSRKPSYTPALENDLFVSGTSTFASSGSSSSTEWFFDGASATYVEQTPNKERGWLLDMPGLVYLIGTAVSVILMIVALFLNWFFVIAESNEIIGITAFSTGLDFWTFVTVLAVGGTLFFLTKGNSRVASVIFAWFGSWWIFLAMAAMISRETFVRAVDLLFEIPNLIVEGTGDFAQFSESWAFDLGPAWYLVFAYGAILVGLSFANLVQLPERDGAKPTI